MSPVGVAEYYIFSPFFENFDSQESFNNWEVVVGGSTSDSWHWVTDYSGNSIDGTAFAWVDSDAAGSGSTMDEYLISPVINSVGASQLFIEFDQYYNNLSDQELADVEVFDGNDWVTVLHQNIDLGSWAAPDHVIINVTEYANALFQIRFHYMAPGWDWYWAIDNVSVHNGASDVGKSLQSFNLYHNGILSGSTSDMTYNYDYAHYLVSGQTYLAEVEAVYTTGVSEKIAYEWTWLPCDNFPGLSDLSAENIEASKDVLIQWSDPNPEHELGIGARISRDGSVIAYIAAPDTSYLDQNLEPGYHDYCGRKSLFRR